LHKLPVSVVEMVSAVAPESLFHEVIETAPAGMVLLDLGGRIRYANLVYAEMLGYTAEELVERSLVSLMYAEDGEEMARLLGQLERGEVETVRVEKRAQSRGRSVLRLCFSFSLLRHTTGEPHALMATVEDVTRRQVADDARMKLQREREQVRELVLPEQTERWSSADQVNERMLSELAAEQLQLLEAIPQMVWVTGPGGELEYVNEHWRAFTKASMGKEVGAWLALIHPEDREWTAQQFDASLRTRRTYEVEHRMRQGDGSYRWVLARAQPLLAPDGRVTHWFGTSTDIHERKTAEELLRRTEKLAAAGRLAATVAHEINNPLEAVGNLLFLALNEHALPPVAARYLQMANEELRRVGQIVSQTLGFYRESNVRQPIELSMLVNDVLSLYQRKLDARQIRVVRQMESGVVVEGIAGELRQVLANLLANALDAMGTNGVLGVAVESTAREGRVTISDTGQGIAPALLNRIFEPFFTTKKDAGTGLGLWVSKGIVEKHQGWMEVESSQGHDDHGTAFVFTLPRQQALPVTA
jgi:PAS domain S-box-containing protein